MFSVSSTSLPSSQLWYCRPRRAANFLHTLKGMSNSSCPSIFIFSSIRCPKSARGWMMTSTPCTPTMQTTHRLCPSSTLPSSLQMDSKKSPWGCCPCDWPTPSPPRMGLSPSSWGRGWTSTSRENSSPKMPPRPLPLSVFPTTPFPLTWIPLFTTIVES